MTEKPDIQIIPNPNSVASAGTDFFTSIAKLAISERGAFKVALSGGSTPGLMHKILTTPPHLEKIDWNRIHFFWGDEREVPSNHPESNFRMAMETLFSRAPVQQDHIHRICAEEGAQKAAQAYEKTMQLVFGISNDEKSAGILPIFDLILLGIGKDGHTASLFPNTRALEENKRWAAANYVPALQANRITLTLPVLNAAKYVIFLVTGSAKAKILADIFNPAAEASLLPAQMVRPGNGKLIWLIDTDAASMLRG